MRLGILQTGHVPPELSEIHGEYPEMFIRMLAPAAPELSFRTYRVAAQELPESAEDCAAWLVTGSKSGAYDPEPWIPPLEAFLRAVLEAGRPVVGVCFGHQILAQALGGRVEKSTKGWGCGVHRYELTRPLSWAPEAGDRLSLHAMHQDQVTAPPPGATVVAASAFCEIAALAYGDPDRPDAVSFQAHPEFDAALARDFVTLRRGDGVPESVADAALASFGAPVMNQQTAAWIARYLRAAGGESAV